MKIIESTEFNITDDKYTVVTVGNFDGVHLGHKSIIENAQSYAGKYNGKVVVVTFYPHTMSVVKPGIDYKFLTLKKEKIKFLKEAGVDVLWIIPFDENIASVPAKEFLSKIIIGKTNAKVVLLGYNHSFGYKGEGNYELVEKVCSEKKIIPIKVDRECLGEEYISSTRIRELISNGNIYLANKLLGYTYQFEGIVKKGEGIGRKLGFPTINIDVDSPLKLLPPTGVYNVEVFFKGEKYVGAMYIGKKETFGNNDKISVEVHILNFNGDLYGVQVLIYVVGRLRDSFKFKNSSELIEHIKEDIKKI